MNIPFGWWDTFNEVLYKAEADALMAAQGGNMIVPLYRETRPTRRDLLAAACLPAIYQHQTMFTDRAAVLAYEQADEMMKVAP